jgi:hypothetical protein
LNVRFDRCALVSRQLLNLRVDVADAVVRIDAERLEGGGVLGEEVLVVRSEPRVRT